MRLKSSLYFLMVCITMPTHNNPTGLKATVNFEGGGGTNARSVATSRANLFATTRRVASE